jgi:glycine hydroxymethyltransferase
MRSRYLNEDIINISGIVNKVIDYRRDRISLISSENISSNLMKLSYCLGLSDQYCSRLPSDRENIDNLTFSNVLPLDEINYITRKSVLEMFNSAECDVRPLSGLSGMNILLFSLLNDNDTLFKVEDMHGGHLSTAPIADRLNIKYSNMKLGKDFKIDIDYFYKLNKENKPKVVFLDSSYVLFPYPLKEIRDVVKDQSIIIYDASHVISLIAASLFQNPFEEGSDIIHSTTHKIFWGPQKSMILFKENNELVKKVQNTIKDLVSNTHLHHILALYIAVIEFKHFGKQYAKNIQSNAKTFAESLSNYGLDVVAKEYGFTESNQVWVNFNTKEKAIYEFKKLDIVNISANLIFLPENKWGWRLAVNELTRYGAGKDEFDKLARIISDLVLENKDVDTIRKECLAFKKSLGDIKYSFDNTIEGRKLMDVILNHMSD